MSTPPPPPLQTPSQALEELLSDYHSFNHPWIEHQTGAPTPLEFLRLVHRNRPVVFSGTLQEWPAMRLWSNVEYLKEKMKGQEIVVAETPSGNADSVVRNTRDGVDYFVKPHQTKESFGEFLDYIQAQSQRQRQNKDKDIDAAPDHDLKIKYAQSQDDNLHHEYSSLLPDITPDIPWATEALGITPDAINLWIGNNLSTTALHKDNYENIYCQVTGRKTFTLISPFESVCVEERTLPCATYSPLMTQGGGGGGGFRVLPDMPPDVVRFWPTVDPDRPSKAAGKWWRHCSPLKVTLDPGDVLYLPAMWYHKVTQECDEQGLCVAVNYWYDMEFSGPFWPMVGFVRNSARLLRRREKLNEEGGEEEEMEGIKKNSEEDEEGARGE